MLHSKPSPRSGSPRNARSAVELVEPLVSSAAAVLELLVLDVEDDVEPDSLEPWLG
jgi:hypothetical protein